MLKPIYSIKIFPYPMERILLLYGENGSGKSSLYKAVQSFFKSSVDSSVEIATN